jgi:hypothetical protein
MKSIRITFALLVVTGFVAMIMPAQAHAQDKPAPTTAPAQKEPSDPPNIAKTLDVKEKITKTIKLTTQQKERLGIIFTAQATTLETLMGALGQGFTDEVMAKVNQDYAEELGKITTLPEEKQEEAKAALMKKAVPASFDKVAPKAKKDAIAGIRQSFIMMLTQVDGNLTKLQKPQLAKIKKQFLLDFDKEMPKFINGLFDLMKNETINPTKADEAGKGEN